MDGWDVRVRWRLGRDGGVGGGSSFPQVWFVGWGLRLCVFVVLAVGVVVRGLGDGEKGIVVKEKSGRTRWQGGSWRMEAAMEESVDGTAWYYQITYMFSVRWTMRTSQIIYLPKHISFHDMSQRLLM